MKFKKPAKKLKPKRSSPSAQTSSSKTAKSKITPAPAQPARKTSGSFLNAPEPSPQGKSRAPKNRELISANADKSAVVPASPTKLADRTPSTAQVPAAKHPVSAAVPPPRVEPAPTPARKSPRVRKPVKLPPLLLEGDADPTPTVSGPGQRYALAPTPGSGPGPAVTPPAAKELPEAYGTERLFLTARDPHWLYAAWDLTTDQRHHYEGLSNRGKLTLRTHLGQVGPEPVDETDLAPESKSWFVHVPAAGKRYLAELGFYEGEGRWRAIAASGSTLTPPESISEETRAEFATIPPEVSLEKLFEAVQAVVIENVPVSAAAQELPAVDPARSLPLSATVTAPPSTADAAPAAPSLPAELEAASLPPASLPPATTHRRPPLKQAEIARAPRPDQTPTSNGPIKRKQTRSEPTAAPPKWTPAQERAIATVIRLDGERRVWMGSLEITELVRRWLQQDISSAALGQEVIAPAAAPAPVEFSLGGISSPLAAVPGRGPGEKGFWLNVNAELVLYGATEADAKVLVGGRQIRLRPDGTFSYRFALPDGEYPLAISATAADGEGGRSIRLRFSRNTQTEGDVGAHPQAAHLKPPLPEHLT